MAFHTSKVQRNKRDRCAVDGTANCAGEDTLSGPGAKAGVGIRKPPTFRRMSWRTTLPARLWFRWRASVRAMTLRAIIPVRCVIPVAMLCLLGMCVPSLLSYWGITLLAGAVTDASTVSGALGELEAHWLSALVGAALLGVSPPLFATASAMFEAGINSHLYLAPDVGPSSTSGTDEGRSAATYGRSQREPEGEVEKQ